MAVLANTTFKGLGDTRDTHLFHKDIFVYILSVSPPSLSTHLIEGSVSGVVVRSATSGAQVRFPI